MVIMCGRLSGHFCSYCTVLSSPHVALQYFRGGKEKEERGGGREEGGGVLETADKSWSGCSILCITTLAFYIFCENSYVYGHLHVQSFMQLNNTMVNATTWEGLDPLSNYADLAATGFG